MPRLRPSSDRRAAARVRAVTSRASANPAAAEPQPAAGAGEATRAALGPQQLAWLAAVAQHGSFAAAARALGVVPSALTYRVRQIEEALDVLLFDRRARRAQLTPAGAALLAGSAHLLREWDALAQRVRRIATGWEAELTIAADAVIDARTLLELCEAFYGLGAPTRLRLRSETLSGTLHALLRGQADLALGVTLDAVPPAQVRLHTLGEVTFEFVVAPHHPLAKQQPPLTPDDIRGHRIVAVADSAPDGGLTLGLQPGQDVLTVPTMEMKLQAQLRGLGCGWLPRPLVQPYLDAGRLVACPTTLPARTARTGYAWRADTASPQGAGRALRWWLQQLAQPRTRQALLMHCPRPLPTATLLDSGS
ncbi:LysR family transcriptional regulator [Tepidimonas charontis]|uniref:HTH-type transcriptional regulator YhaJ n=1 Tax=Tepidimonas charontis TaxID=2267262 RepID=A0A554XDH0_9BURK|nr:LysR family transcriptional regulator [Tepidimonas charontis]TSE33880.1 HTH-type transcriptional regulator YhaJ [Tepidimonas charontis]